MFLPRKLSAPKPWVWERDDALAIPDRAAFEPTEEGRVAYEVARAAYEAAWATFRQTGDWSVLPCKPGEKPTVFMIASLTIDQIKHIDGLGPGDMFIESIAYGVYDILNLRFIDEATGEDVKVRRRESRCGLRLEDEYLVLFQDDRLRVACFLAIKRAGQVTKEAAKSN